MMQIRIGFGTTPMDNQLVTTFDLTIYDPASAKITGQWGVDNFGDDVEINGASTGNTVNVFLVLAPLTIDSGFLEGQNMLRFVARDVGANADF